MCGLSFFYYCSVKRISLILFFLSLEVRVFDLVVKNVFNFFFLLAEKPNCGLYNVFVNVFICKLYTFFMMNKSCLPFFCNQVVFLFLIFVLCFIFNM